MKKVISMLVVMIMLISSFGAFSVSAAEPETYPDTLFYDFNTYKGDSYTWGTNIGKWGDKRWESSGGSGAYQFDDEHSYVYKFKATNAAPRLNLDEKVTGGKYLIAFDWYIEKGNTPRVILRLRDENSNSSSIGEIRGNVVKYSNSFKETWNFAELTTIEDGKWYNIAFSVDKDNETVDYYVDGKWYAQKSGTIVDFNQIYLDTSENKFAVDGVQKEQIAYMDNFLAGYAGNASATLSSSKITADGNISFTTTYPVDTETLSEVKLLDSESAEVLANVTASADGKTITVSPLANLNGESTYTVDLSNLKSIYKIGYLEKSLTVTTAKAYTAQREDFETYKGNSIPWTNNMASWKENWSSSAASGPKYFNDGHGYVYKFYQLGAKPTLILPETVTEGKYLISFDYYVPADSVKRNGLFLYDADGSTKISFGVINGFKFIAGNFTSNWPGWNGDGDFVMSADRWYNFAFIIDKDNGAIEYYVDGVLVKRLTGTIPAVKKVLFDTNSGSQAEAYMDNVYAGSISEANAAVNDATVDGGIRIMLEHQVDAETLNTITVTDNSGNVIETSAILSNDKKTVYVMADENLNGASYTVDLSGLRSVYGGKYVNRTQTVGVSPVYDIYKFDDVNTGAWNYVPNGFTTGGTTGRYFFEDGHGYTYYSRNNSGTQSLSKKLDTPITEGKICIGFDFYSFEAGTAVKLLTDHYTDATNYTTSYLMGFVNGDRIILYDDVSINSYTVYEEYSQNRWYNVGIVIDLDNNVATIYLDGEKIAERTYMANSIGRIRFDAKSTFDTDKHYAIDNVSIVHMSRTVAKSYKAFAGANNFYINFNAPINADTISNIVLKDKNGNEIATKKSLKDAGKKLVLTFDGELTLGETYTVLFDGLCDVANHAVITDEMDITAVTRPEPVYSPLTVSDSRVMSTVTNAGEVAKSHKIIVAGYTGSVATVIGIGDVSFTADDTTKVLSYDFSNLDLSGCDSAKAFLWNNFADVTPLVEALPLEI